MYQLEKVKQNIANEINKVLKKNVVSANDLVYPPNPAFGDLSLPCFNLAKELKKTAVETGEFLVGKIELNDTVVAAKAIGPFLNFTFNKAKLAQGVIEEIAKAKNKYGLNNLGQNKKVMVEFSNANTHKEYHVGHLRNVCYGEAVTKILSANGFKAIPVSYINDFGIHVAKTLWAFNKFYKKEKLPLNKGYFLGKVYVKACAELENNETAKIEVAEIMKKIESRAGADYKLWQKTRTWSINGFDKIYKELGVKFEHIFYESEAIDKGLDMVAKLYAKHFLIKSQGAIIADLNKYDLGVLVILRGDGTALYPVADLALAEEKFKKYKIDKSIYIVDVRQGLYFKQLFKVLELLGFKQEMKHLSYEFVKLPEGMMSSRTGQVITYEDLRAQAMKKALSETKKRHKNWSEKKLASVVNKLVNGALKFEMLKAGADKVITFDIGQALRFDGYTAAYLQYTAARINSIIRKTGGSKLATKIKYEALNDAKELALVNKLSKYPEIVTIAGKNYNPSELAKYLFELAQELNDYYHAVPVLKAKEEIRRARLALIMAVRQTLENGLGLLGIETMEEM
ncbi:MAG: arginine--tRNA ligase [Patescibacteria group bacterium]|nr:arginine--tRNA ligase [Patescibacteria group bacterium]